MPGSILPILTSATPKRPCTGWLTSPDGSENAASAIAGSMIADFAIRPRSTSERLRLRSLARSSNDVPDVDAAARSLRFAFVGKHDLRDLALLGRAELVAVLLEDLLRVLVGDLGPFADLFRRDHDKGDLAIFGRAELGLVVVEIGGQRFGRGRIDRAGLRGVELDVLDRALLVLETGQRIDQHLWRLEAGGDRAGNLAAQPDAALFGEIALFGVAELPDRGLEARGSKSPLNPLKLGSL